MLGAIKNFSTSELQTCFQGVYLGLGWAPLQTGAQGAQSTGGESNVDTIADYFTLQMETLKLKEA